jgi:hypothetical protein
MEGVIIKRMGECGLSSFYSEWGPAVSLLNWTINVHALQETKNLFNSIRTVSFSLLLHRAVNVIV